jgi:hypothetical protein
MVGLLKSLFRSSWERQKQKTDVASVKTMSLDDIVAHIKFLGDPVRKDGLTLLIQRLYTIAFYENHVSNQNRENAARLAELLTTHLEKAWEDNPQAIAALKIANDNMIENASIFGVGSIVWKIKEESIPDAAVVAYAMRPEHRHLVPNFLEVLGAEHAQKNKHEYVRQIVLSENYEGSNAVIILHGLAVKGDKAVAALFNKKDFAALVNIPNNYVAGREVLVNLGLLPKQSNARPFQAISETKSAIANIINLRNEDDNNDSRLKGLSEEERAGLLLALDLLRLVLATGHLAQIYGKEMAEQSLEMFGDPTIKYGIERIRKIPELVLETKFGMPIDYVILDQVLSLGGNRAQTEVEYEKLKPLLEMGADWLNHERVGFQNYLRFTLRFFADPMPNIKSPIDDELNCIMRDIYLRKGSNAALAEKALYGEDWIGTES